MVGSTPENVETSRELIKNCLPVQNENIAESIPNIEDSSIFFTNQNHDVSVESMIGTYDESTHTLTIVVPSSEESVCLEEAIQEVVVTSDNVTVVPPPSVRISSCKEEVAEPISPHGFRTVDNLSPAPCSPHIYETNDNLMKVEKAMSDCGYESLDSPQSEISGKSELSDLWNESFSQLFPALV